MILCLFLTYLPYSIIRSRSFEPRECSSIDISFVFLVYNWSELSPSLLPFLSPSLFTPKNYDGLNHYNIV